MAYRYSESQYKRIVITGFVFLTTGTLALILFSLNILKQSPALHLLLMALGIFFIFALGVPRVIQGFKQRLISYEIDHGGFRIVHPQGIKTTIKWEDITGFNETRHSIKIITIRGQEEIFKNLEEYPEFYETFQRFSKRLVQKEGSQEGGKAPEEEKSSAKSPPAPRQPVKPQGWKPPQRKEEAPAAPPPKPAPKPPPELPKVSTAQRSSQSLIEELVPQKPAKASAPRPVAPLADDKGRGDFEFSDFLGKGGTQAPVRENFETARIPQSGASQTPSPGDFGFSDFLGKGGTQAPPAGALETTKIRQTKPQAPPPEPPQRENLGDLMQPPASYREIFEKSSHSPLKESAAAAEGESQEISIPTVEEMLYAFAKRLKSIS
ncbi:MAG: hypothetical protein RDV48_07325 [Candidatus Eremiobacteraeota bacterium]|nr:hypothetical protein [Candidatus Eremiobacteraeota bacterium]